MDGPLRWPAKLPLLDHSGVRLRWISRARAIELWRDGNIRLHVRRRVVRAVQTWPTGEELYYPRASPSGGRRYSHDRETQENPEGCWTLIKIRNREQAIFLRVASDCGAVRRVIRRRPHSPDSLAA